MIFYTNMLLLIGASIPLPDPCLHTQCPTAFTCISTDTASSCVQTSDSLEPPSCDCTMCPEGTACFVAKNTIICQPAGNRVNDPNPCDDAHCPDGEPCVLDHFGYPRCSDGTDPCDGVRCPNGTHCVVDQSGYPKCSSNETDPCGNLNCPNGTYCVVDQWGYAWCSPEADPCR